MRENVGRANLPWSLSSLKLATSWFDVSIPSCVLLVKFGKLKITAHTSASFPLEVENLLVCLNLENPKADVPFLVKNPFLKSEAWGF